MAEGLEGLLTGHTLVKRYRIEEVIGRGGFAVVYRATDTRLGRPVAVKVITLTAEDPEQREQLRARLHREARAAASLPHHPNLVTVHDVGTDPELGLDFLVMELLEGENLSQALADGTPPMERALRILRDTAEGLAVGHRAGLVHRDVKPANIFLAAPHDGAPGAFRVCLLDYGIAQAIEDDQTVTRGMGANPLSPAFASPEQLAGSRELSPATDVFSLGVVGYQLLTGERPFSPAPGQAPTGWEVRKPITDLNAEVPLAVEAVLMRAMSVDPRERYPDADAFADALDVALVPEDETQLLAARVAGPGLGAVVLDDDDDATMIAPPPAAVPVAAAAAPVDHPGRPVPPLRVPAPRRKRSKMPVVLVLALLLAAAAAWAAMSGGGGRDGGGGQTAAGGDTAVVDDSGQPVESPVVDRGDPTAEQPTESIDLQPSAGTGGTSPAAPSGQPAVIVPGQPQQPTAPQQPTQPQPQQPTQPQQPQQPNRPPAPQPQPQQPTPQQPQPQPQQPPAQPQQPQPQPQPQQPPVQPEPEPEPTRPEPPLLGRPIEPRPDAPRDTILIRPPGALR